MLKALTKVYLPEKCARKVKMKKHLKFRVLLRVFWVLVLLFLICLTMQRCFGLSHLSWDGYWKYVFDQHKTELKKHKAELEKQGLSGFNGKFSLQLDPPLGELSDKIKVLENIFRPDSYKIGSIEELSNPTECGMTISISVNKLRAEISLNSKIYSIPLNNKGSLETKTVHPYETHSLWPYVGLFLLWVAGMCFLLKEFSKEKGYEDYIRFIVFWHHLSILTLIGKSIFDLKKQRKTLKEKGFWMSPEAFFKEVKYFSEEEEASFSALIMSKNASCPAFLWSFLASNWIKKDKSILNLNLISGGIGIDFYDLIGKYKNLKKKFPLANEKRCRASLTNFILPILQTVQTAGKINQKSISDKTGLFFSLLESFLENAFKNALNYGSAEKIEWSIVGGNNSVKISVKNVIGRNDVKALKALIQQIPKDDFCKGKNTGYPDLKKKLSCYNNSEVLSGTAFLPAELTLKIYEVGQEETTYWLETFLKFSLGNGSNGNEAEVVTETEVAKVTI
jgi:hypothetical protein